MVTEEIELKEYLTAFNKLKRKYEKYATDLYIEKNGINVTLKQAAKKAFIYAVKTSIYMMLMLGVIKKIMNNKKVHSNLNDEDKKILNNFYNTFEKSEIYSFLIFKELEKLLCSDEF